MSRPSLLIKKDAVCAWVFFSFLWLGAWTWSCRLPWALLSAARTFSCTFSVLSHLKQKLFPVTFWPWMSFVAIFASLQKLVKARNLRQSSTRCLKGTFNKKRRQREDLLQWLRWQSLSAVQETWVWSLGQEDPLEKEMATHSSVLAWKIPWMEEPGRLQCVGSQRVRHNWATFTFTFKTLNHPHPQPPANLRILSPG